MRGACCCVSLVCLCCAPVCAGALTRCWGSTLATCTPALCRALFAFSTEVLPSKQQELEGGQAVVLQPTGRYAHSRGHVDATAAATGWAVCEMQQSIIRFNAGKPIHGNLCVMRRL